MNYLLIQLTKMKYIITEEQKDKHIIRKFKLLSEYLDSIYHLEVKKKYPYPTSTDMVYLWRDDSNKIVMAIESWSDVLGVDVKNVFPNIRTIFDGIPAPLINEFLKYYIKENVGVTVNNFHHTTWD